MFKTVHTHYPEYSHSEFRCGSLGGALVALLKDVRPNSKTKVKAFVDHKGVKKQWVNVRTTLSTKKVRSHLLYSFKTELTDDGIIFYAMGGAYRN